MVGYVVGCRWLHARLQVAVMDSVCNNEKFFDVFNGCNKKLSSAFANDPH